jgi:tetratricopeptide (TPR) repeat protein
LALAILLSIGLAAACIRADGADVLCAALMLAGSAMAATATWLLGDTEALAYFGVPLGLGRCQDLMARVVRLSGDAAAQEAVVGLSTIVINALAPRIAGASAPHAHCLRGAYLFRGDAQRRRRDPSAITSYLEASRLGALPPAACAIVARHQAATGVDTPDVVDIYLTYVAEARGATEADTGEDLVLAHLENLCRVDDATSPEECIAREVLNRRALAADQALDWAHHYLAAALGARGEYEEALASSRQASTLNPKRRDSAYFVALFTGVVAACQHEWHSAVPHFDRASAMDAKRPHAHFWLAVAGIVDCEGLSKADAPGAAEAIVARATASRRSAEHARTRWHGRAAAFCCAGRASMFMEDYRGAIDAFRSAIELSPRSEQYRLFLAEALGMVGEQAAALDSLTQMPTDPADDGELAVGDWTLDVHQVRGSLLAQGGSLAQAIEEYERATGTGYSADLTHFGLATVLFALGRACDAIQRLDAVSARLAAQRRVRFLAARCRSACAEFGAASAILAELTARPDATAEWFYWLGSARSNNSEVLSAVAAFSEAIRRDPTNSHAYLLRGHCWYSQEDLDSAAADYSKAHVLAPADIAVAMALAGCLILQRKLDAARPVLADALAFAGADYDTNVAMGTLLESADDRAGACVAYGRALRAEHPSPITALARLGILYAHDGRFAEAGDHLERAVELGKGPATELTRLDEAVLYELGYCQAAEGRFAASVETWQLLLQRHDQDRELQASIDRSQHLLAEQHFEAGRYDEAASVLETLIESRPDDPQLRRDVLELHFRAALESTDSAWVRRGLARLLERDPDHTLGQYYLAVCDLADGDFARAAQGFEAVAARDSSEPVRNRCQYQRALALVQLGRTNDAALVLEALLAGQSETEHTDPDVRWLLAYSHATAERWEQAVHALQLPSLNGDTSGAVA